MGSVVPGSACCGGFSHWRVQDVPSGAALRANVWFEFVPSGANISDLPSRNEFTRLRQLGGVAFDVEWPVFDGSWSEIFFSTFGRHSSGRTTSSKRSYSEIQKELSAARKLPRT